MVKDMVLQQNDFKGKGPDSQEASPRKSLAVNPESYDVVRDTGETPSENHISTPNMFLYGPRGSHMNSRAKLEKVAQLHLDNTQGSGVKTNVYQIHSPIGGFTTDLLANQDLASLKPTQNMSEFPNNEGHSIFEMQPKNIEGKDLELELVQ